MCGRKYDSEVAEKERQWWLGRSNLHRDILSATKQMFDMGLQPNYDIRPTNPHVVVRARDGEAEPVVMSWGFQPPTMPRIIINSRSDKLDSRAWSKAFRERRCLIPVGGYFEWTGPKGKRVPHAITLAQCPVLFLAGLWLEYDGEPRYSVITTEPRDFMARIHDREAVFVRDADCEEYLFSKEPPRGLLRPGEEGEIREFVCSSPVKDKPPEPV